MTTVSDPSPFSDAAPTPAGDPGGPAEPGGSPPTGEPTVDEVAERIFSAALGAFDTLNVYLGDRLGWYRTLAGAGPLSAAELADRSGSDERYCREWLEQQAVTGILTAVEPEDAGGARRFLLPAAATEVLTDSSSLSYLAPLSRFVGAAAVQLPGLVAAYRNGGGVGWSEFGEDARVGQADMNRPWFEHALADALRGVPDLHEILSRPGARFADVGCGEAWSSIALGRAYPEATVQGYDPDGPSTIAAAAHTAEAGLTGRVAFSTADAASAMPDAAYDVVFAFECLHDLPHPVEILAAARRSLRPDGVVVVMARRRSRGPPPRAETSSGCSTASARSCACRTRCRTNRPRPPGP